MIALALASLATLAWLYRKLAAGQPLLAYAPRRPVPWSFAPVALALAPALALIGISAGAGQAASGPIRAISPEQMLSMALMHVFLALLCYALLAAAFRADALDLGLPQNSAELVRDLQSGMVAYLAVLLPVYAIQFALTAVLAPQEVHPIIEQLEMNYSPALMLAAAAGAVVGAPLFEETTFRLIFQGWLERHEGTPETTAAFEAVETVDAGILSGTNWNAGDGAMRMPDHEGAAIDAPALENTDGAAIERTVALADFAPDRPCNWAAIVVSSSLFALAHLGQGVAPFSLFPLGMALGYLYQRTHRIVPSMVCHALFNATSLLALWLALSGEKQ
jgi:membrane protease YdiL (CAAX protease family)